ncbi:MAG TPA: hypothetical protein VM425_14675 [Myxococcota bacterium]|nr:hypothetical protein [Myxococcota bacterium]
MSYADRFEQCQVPEVDDLHGFYAVKLVVPLVPDIRFFRHKKYFPGSDDHSDRGYNCFLGHIKIGAFRLERDRSDLADGLDVVKIIYDDPTNPGFLQRLTDEVREERGGCYFCRGVYDIFGRPTNVMYFTLTKLD